MKPALDVITIGRSSVDLYGQQVGGRLEDMASFAKAVGGCPANIAIGTARLGLKSGLITRVGDEPMGRFIREQMEREGVATKGIVTDPERLTALVILGVRDEKTFPLIFYRDNCADMALDGGRHRRRLHRLGRAPSSSPARISRARTRPPRRRRRSASPRRMAARSSSTSTTAPTSGALPATAPAKRATSRSDAVTEHLQPILADCDLIVGTEEELHIAGGSEDTLAAIRAIRARLAGDHRVQARPDGLRGVSRRDSRPRSRRRQGSRLPGRGLQRARRRRCLHVRLPARLAEGRAARDLLRLCQCLRRLRGVAPALLAGDPDLRRAAAFPAARQPAQGAAPRRRTSTTSIGRRRAGRGPTR